MNNNTFILWLMGPTSAGKTTIGRLFVDNVRSLDVPAIHYDGNEVRAFFAPKMGFRPEDRLRAVSACVHLANKAFDAGLNVVVSALTANEDARQFVRTNVRNLVLAYLRCPMEVCFKRDSLGLYRKARNGEIDPNMITGMLAPYAPPSDPDIILDTDKLSPEQSIESLKAHLDRAGYRFPKFKVRNN